MTPSGAVAPIALLPWHWTRIDPLIGRHRAQTCLAIGWVDYRLTVFRRDLTVPVQPPPAPMAVTSRICDMTSDVDASSRLGRGDRRSRPDRSAARG